MSMGKIYKNQDYLRITVHIEHDLSDAASITIKYKDPNGDEGNWVATIEDEEEGIVYKDFALGSSLGISGEWTFWAYVIFNDGRLAPGDPFTQMIYDEGS